MKAYLVLIETSGNQQYIFSTNKLRENVGASELTYRVGTEWTLGAVHRQTEKYDGQPLWPTDGDAQQLRRNLLNSTINPPLESPGNRLPVEVILATSGKALLLVKDSEVGRQIIQDVTTDALKKAPGLDVCGVVSEELDWEGCPLGVAILRLHELFEETRAQRPGPMMRFLRLPVVAECASSGLPAKKWHVPGENDGIEPAARSAVTLAKWKYRKRYKDRMEQLLNRERTRLRFIANIEKLEQQADWIAIIHADGNGLGQIFLNFDEYADCADNRDYVVKLRRFSLGLDLCTERAFMSALDKWVRYDTSVWYRLPLLPIVLGGDDMTVVCDGRAAIPFTRQFLIQFEEETGRTKDLSPEDQPLYQIIQGAARKALSAPRLSACAGISIVKPHYPFSGAYEIAEELLQSAKRIKNVIKSPANGFPWPASALDFHIHYDTSGNDLDRVRERLKLADDSQLYCRPYVVSNALLLDNELEEFGEATMEARKWVDQHHWDKLQQRVNKLTEKDVDGRRKLPNSQMHDLRAGLFLGREAANARYELIRHRYDSIDIFGGENNDLFEEEIITDPITSDDSRPRKNIYHTNLLDALDVATLQDERLAKAQQSDEMNGGRQ